MSPNLAAFLSMIANAEGVDNVKDVNGVAVDPFRVCYGKKHIIINLAYHPRALQGDGTREWDGELLSDAQCIAAGLKPPCFSSAAGKFQINLPTFERVQKKIALPDFFPASQVACTTFLLQETGALTLIEQGLLVHAITLCCHLWASLPGNTSKQPQRSFASLIGAYSKAGGSFA
jgi:muramidase (phage lysozyme)